MRQKIVSFALSFFTAFIFPVVVFAQEKAAETAKTAEEIGLDKQIDQAFKPISDWWTCLIFLSDLERSGQ